MNYFKTFFTYSIISLFCILFTFAQEGETSYFEGTITYEVKFSGAAAENLQVNEANNELVIHMKDGDYIINLKGGRYPKTFMYVNKKDIEYSVDVSEKKAYIYSSHTDINRETHKEEPPIAQNTGKSDEVNGIMCDIYRMKKGDDYFTFFVSDQYVVDLVFFEGKKRAKPLFLVKGLDGKIPLKIIRKTPNLTVVTTVKQFTPRTFSTEQFELPTDFEVSKRDYRP
jgi:hypothetical protein